MKMDRFSNTLDTQRHKYDSHIEIEGEGKNINAKSLMGIMAFGLKEGIEVKVIAAGSDENEATDAIKNFLTCND